ARWCFGVGAVDAVRVAVGGWGNVQRAIVAEREVVLANVGVLGQGGVVVVLAGPLGEAGDLAVESQGRLEGQVEGAPVHHRQDARHADADGARRRVGRQAELRAATAEQLGAREQLDMHFQADDDAVVHGHHSKLAASAGQLTLRELPQIGYNRAMSDTLSGLIERVTFHNADTGFAVLRVQADRRSDSNLVTVVGHLPTAVAGEYLEATGAW